MTCLLSIALELLAVRTARVVLMHLDETFYVHVSWRTVLGLCLLQVNLLCVERWLVVCLTKVERQLSTSSSTVASSSTAASTSEEEGLHTGLFLTTSARTCATSPCTSEGGRQAPDLTLLARASDVELTRSSSPARVSEYLGWRTCRLARIIFSPAQVQLCSLGLQVEGLWTRQAKDILTGASCCVFAARVVA